MYFDEIMNRIYHSDLMCDIDIEFLNDENKLPTKYEFENFTLQRKLKLSSIIERLTSSEKVIFFEKLKKELSGYYGGIRHHFFTKISAVNILSELPQYKDKDEFTITGEEATLLESKYSLYPLFEKALNELLIIVNQIEKTSTPHPNELYINNKPKNNKDENPYPRIFPALKHFELFEYWHNAVQENELAEYSFIYRQMIMDGFIYEDIKPTEFINWLNNTYEIALDELKQYNNCKGGGKIPRYQTTKLLFK